MSVKGVYKPTSPVKYFGDAVLGSLGPTSWVWTSNVPPRQRTAEFLTAITDPVERRFRPGLELHTAKTDKELERDFRASNVFTDIQEEITSFRNGVDGD